MPAQRAASLGQTSARTRSVALWVRTCATVRWPNRDGLRVRGWVRSIGHEMPKEPATVAMGRTRVCCEFAVVCGERLGRLAAHPAHEAVPGTTQHASHSTQHATQHAHVCCTARQSLGTGRVARRTTATALLQRSLPYTLATHAAAGRNGRSHPVRPQSHVGCCATVHCTCMRSVPLRVARMRLCACAQAHAPRTRRNPPGPSGKRVNREPRLSGSRVGSAHLARGIESARRASGWRRSAKRVCSACLKSSASIVWYLRSTQRAAWRNRLPRRTSRTARPAACGTVHPASAARCRRPTQPTAPAAPAGEPPAGGPECAAHPLPCRSTAQRTARTGCGEATVGATSARR